MMNQPTNLDDALMTSGVQFLRRRLFATWFVLGLHFLGFAIATVLAAFASLALMRETGELGVPANVGMWMGPIIQGIFTLAIYLPQLILLWNANVRLRKALESRSSTDLALALRSLRHYVILLSAVLALILGLIILITVIDLTRILR